MTRNQTTARAFAGLGGVCLALSVYDAFPAFTATHFALVGIGLLLLGILAALSEIATLLARRGLLVMLVLLVGGCAWIGDAATHKCSDAPADSAWARSRACNP
jgi:hypothetical protein